MGFLGSLLNSIMKILNIKILKAGNGDSILINFIDDIGLSRNILIDGGNKKSEFNNNLKCEVLDIQNKKENIDLLIITHTDQDHIKGIYYLLNDYDIDKNIIKEIWFNSFYPINEFQNSENNDISFIESCKVQTLIDELGLNRKSNIYLPNINKFDFMNLKFTILSPYHDDVEKLKIENLKNNPSIDISSNTNDYNFTISELIEKNSIIFVHKKEDLDDKIENRVSIAFLLEYNSKSILFLGDANSDIVVKSLREIIIERNIDKLKVDYVKLSHHASHRSLGFDLLDIIDCNNFIISANGGKANLPNKLTIAKILSRRNRDSKADTFIFNYDEVLEKLNFSDFDYKEYNFNSILTNYKNGYKIDL